MTRKEMRQALRRGKFVYGTAVSAHDPHWVPFMCSTGMECVFIDTEHLPLDRERFCWMAQLYAANGVVPLLRVPRPDPVLLCQALDQGAGGVIIPYVEDAETVRRAERTLRWRPLQGEKFERLLGGEALDEATQAFLDKHNEGFVLIAMIESQTGIDNLEAICAAGVDAVLIGPQDLSISLGVPEQYDSPEFDKAVRYILSTARKAGVGAGIHFSEPMDLEIGWLKETGANFIMHGSDRYTAWKGVRDQLTRLREALEG